MRKDIYARRLAEAQERIVAAAGGLGMNVSIPPARDADLRLLQFAEQLAGEMELLAGAAPDAEVDDAERIEAAVGEANAQALADAGFDAVVAIVAASDDDLDAVDGIGPATVAKLREAFGS